MLMSIEELIGSLLMFGFRGATLNDEECRTDIEELKANHVKGVILFDHDIAGNHRRNIHSPEQLCTLIESLRNELGSDLVVAIDQEGGAVDRLKHSNGFLKTHSASDLSCSPESDINDHSMKQARQLARLGIDLNFGPCVDLAIEEDSPIIAARGRSYGRDPEVVSRCAQIVIDEHHRARVGCCIKHFPGHGSAMIDSHKGVCDITRTHQQSEIDVFRDLISIYGDRIAVMSGHLMHQRVDPDLPASLSKKHTAEFLRESLGFDGVVVTDSLDMRAIRDGYGEVDSALLALDAGVDIILDGLNAPGYREPGAPTRIARGIKNAVVNKSCTLNEDRLVQSTTRIERFMADKADQNAHWLESR
jgi:beta-N-acetylhexosaminidase